MRYYSDGTAITFVHHETSVLWKSDKNKANELIKKLERVLYEDDE